jgi:alpha-N-arabinofuranosidase
MEHAGQNINYLAIHRYAHLFADEPFQNYMAFAADLDERLRAFEGLICAVSLERAIKHEIGIAVDEWAIWRYPVSLRLNLPVTLLLDKNGQARLPMTHTDISPDYLNAINLEDALVTALYLNAFIRHAHSVRIANFAAMPTLMGFDLMHPENPIVPPTIFYPFELYSRTSGQLALDVFWNCETFSGVFKDRSYSGLRILDVAATLDVSQKRLVIYVVNQSETKSMEAIVSLVSGRFEGNVIACIINGPDIKSENSKEKPKNVAPREIVFNASGQSLNFTFEPHSVTALICAIS